MTPKSTMKIWSIMFADISESLLKNRLGFARDHGFRKLHLEPMVRNRWHLPMWIEQHLTFPNQDPCVFLFDPVVFLHRNAKSPTNLCLDAILYLAELRAQGLQRGAHIPCVSLTGIVQQRC